MQALRQMGGGLLYGLISIVIVIGALSLGIAESYTAPSPTPAPLLPTIIQTLVSTHAGPTTPPSATLPPTSTPPPPTNCPPPFGWTLIPVGPQDTLPSLAYRYGTTPAQLAAANCLLTTNLLPGYGIYVPSIATYTALACGVPAGWVHSYIVQAGDTLSQIAAAYGTSYPELQRANCLSTTDITVGQILWVPNAATATPAGVVELFLGGPTAPPTDILPTLEQPTATYAPPPTNTATSLPPTNTATKTPGPTASNTAVPPSATKTPSPTASSTPAPPTATITAFPTKGEDR